MNAPAARRGRLQLMLIAAVFIGPLVLATWMYRSGALAPDGSSNNGVLIEPVVSIAATIPGSPLIAAAEGRWIMLYSSDSECLDSCRAALHRMRQTRLMLGREMERVERVFLRGESAPDRVFLEGEHPGLQTINDKGLGILLEEKRPGNTMPDGIYLLDPLANLVMYFPPDLDPRELVDDVKHLLKLSRIG